MEVRHAFGGGLYAKAMHFEAGEVIFKHKHDFDHLSILAKGTVEVVIDGERRVITAPKELLIEAGKQHSVKGLVQGIWYCIHKTDCTDADVVDDVLMGGG